MTEATFTRTGAARRQKTAPTPTPRRSRRPITPGPLEATPTIAESTPAVATSTEPQPAPAPVTPGAVATGPSPVAARLAVALLTCDDELRAVITGYRAQGFDAAEWTLVGDLIHLGLAAYGPRNKKGVHELGWALSVHARIHLLLGTSQTITGWYGHDAIETSLGSTKVKHGGGSFVVPGRFASSFAGRLRTIGRTLVASNPPAPKKFSAHDRQAPLMMAELDEVFEFCDSPGRRAQKERLHRLTWLVLGTGAKNADLVGATGPHVEMTDHAVVFTTAGDTPRRIPVFAACEAAVLDIAFAAGDGLLLPGLSRETGLADTIIVTSGWREAKKFPLTAGRLRQTWLAAVLAGGAPLAGVLTAAGLVGDRTFADVICRLPPLADVTYETGLRCSTGPLPSPGQLLLPGAQHATPHIPLLDPP